MDEDYPDARDTLRALQSFPLDNVLPASPNSPSPRPAPQPPMLASPRRSRARHIPMREPARLGLFTVCEVDEPDHDDGDDDDVFSSRYTLSLAPAATVTAAPEEEPKSGEYILRVPSASSSSESFQQRLSQVLSSATDLPSDVDTSTGSSGQDGAEPVSYSPSDIQFSRLSWASTSSTDSVASTSPPVTGWTPRQSSSQEAAYLPRTPESENNDPFVARGQPVMLDKSSSPYYPIAPRRASSSSRRSPPPPLDLRPRQFPSDASCLFPSSTGLLPALPILNANDWRSACDASSPRTPAGPARTSEAPFAPRRPQRPTTTSIQPEDLDAALDDLLRSCGEDSDDDEHLASRRLLFPLPPARAAGRSSPTVSSSSSSSAHQHLFASAHLSPIPSLISPAAESDISVLSPRTPLSAIARTPASPPAMHPWTTTTAPRTSLSVQRPPLPEGQPPASPLLTSRLAKRTYVRPDFKGDHSFLRCLSTARDGESLSRSSSRSSGRSNSSGCGSDSGDDYSSRCGSAAGASTVASSRTGSSRSSSRKGLPSRSRLPAEWYI